MKFQPEKSDGPAINAYGPGWVSIDGEKVYSSVVIGRRGQRFDWDCARYAALSAAHFNRLAGAAGKRLKVHLAVDTGMGRGGFLQDDLVENMRAPVKGRLLRLV